MTIIRPDGPVIDPQTNIAHPGNPVKWVKVDEFISTTIKPTAITYTPKKPLVLPPVPENAIFIAGEHTDRDFTVKPTMGGTLKILHANNEAQRRTHQRTLQPPPPAKIYNPDEEEPWPYAVKLDKPAPKPNLKFNPETHTPISTIIKNQHPYIIVQKDPTILTPPKTGDPHHITAKPW